MGNAAKPSHGNITGALISDEDANALSTRLALLGGQGPEICVELSAAGYGTPSALGRASMWSLARFGNLSGQRLGAWLAIMLITSLSLGCVLTPHENFKKNLQFAVGSRADRPNAFMRPDAFVSESLHSDGNVEYSYIFGAGCTMKFLVDANTKIIIRANYDGSPSACVWVP